jgi:lipase chaperone LimK
VKTRYATAAALSAGLLALGGWWGASVLAPSAPAAGGAHTSASAAATDPAAAPGLQQAQAFAAPRGGVQADSLLTRGLRHRIEAMMLEVPDAGSPQELKQRLAALIPRHFSAAEAARAAQLVERYVDYRVALSSLKPPRDMTDPKLLREIIDARRKIRERHFAPEEYDALFAQEEELDRFTVARLEIARDTSLTPAQKQAALKEAERGLSESQRAARSEATLHETVAAQTAAFEAAGVSEQQRYEQRRAAYGEAAAQQLAQLDREERDWQARLSQFTAARATLTAQQLDALKQQLFSEQEQMRLDAALALRESTRK